MNLYTSFSERNLWFPTYVNEISDSNIRNTPCKKLSKYSYKVTLLVSPNEKNKRGRITKL